MHVHIHRYDFKVSNRVGSVEGSLSLVVRDEEEEERDRGNSSTESRAVRLEELGDYVAEMHGKNNHGFVLQFQVVKHNYLASAAALFH